MKACVSISVDEEGGEAKEKEDGEEKKKRQTRGGKAMMKAKKKVEPQGIKMWTQTRGKKKKVTLVVGLASYGNNDLCELFLYNINK